MLKNLLVSDISKVDYVFVIFLRCWNGKLSIYQATQPELLEIADYCTSRFSNKIIYSLLSVCDYFTLSGLFSLSSI